MGNFKSIIGTSLVIIVLVKYTKLGTYYYTYLALIITDVVIPVEVVSHWQHFSIALSYPYGTSKYSINAISILLCRLSKSC